VLGGNQILGKIDPLGNYRAPNVMPDPLPPAIEIGFSFDRDDPVELKVPILLAELFLFPDRIVSVNAGVADQLQAFLLTSDKAFNKIPIADVAFQSSDDTIATAGNDGTVNTFDKLGHARIQAVHRLTNAVAAADVYSRSDINLFANVELMPKDFARVVRQEGAPNNSGSVQEIEFTHPGGVFYLRPLVEILRGHGAGTKFSGVNHDFIKITSNSPDIKVHNRIEDRVPQPSGVIAVVETYTGGVIIGNKPGSGTVTITYDDTYVQHSIDVKITFTRLDVELNLVGHLSNDPVDAFVTERIFLEVMLSNAYSGFVDETPVEITMGEGETFHITYGMNVNSGNANFWLPYNQADETNEIRLRISSNLDDLENPWMALAGTDPMGLGAYISPKRIGDHLFKVRVLNDVEIEPVESSINVIRPPLAVYDPVKRDIVETPPWIVLNSWIKIRQKAKHVPYRASVFELYTDGGVFATESNNPPMWSILRTEDNTIEEFPVTDLELGTFSTVFDKAGDNLVHMKMLHRPELRSDDLTIKVVRPEEVANVEVVPQFITIIDGTKLEIPRSNQLGTLMIMEPVKARWAPGVEIPIQIQTFNAMGAPASVGHTHISRNKNRNGETLSYSTITGVWLFSNSGPQFETVGNLYPPDGSGLISFRIIPTFSETDDNGNPLPLETDEEDIIIEIFPRFITPTDPVTGGYIIIPGLPVEEENYTLEKHLLVKRTYAPYARAEFTSELHNGFLNQSMLINGGGVAVDPRELPVASPRLRQAVANGILPSASLDVTFHIQGTHKFTESLAAGLRSADLGDGITLKKTTVEGSRLKVVLNTSVNAERGDRDVTFTFNDNKEWVGKIDLFQVELGYPPVASSINVTIVMTHQ